MKLKNRFLTQRIIVIFFFFIITSVGLAILLYTFNSNIVLYETPSTVLNDSYIDGNIKPIRIGGVVKERSIKYINDVVEFVIHDDKREMKAIYKGVVPSLFKEGQNVIIYGKFNRNEGQFEAKELLAKHDENYIPDNYKNKINNLK
ncbi:MAG: cytochrome c maturation protein CcmE [Rickettsiales bacterium]|jgi:cytochrome c-type biogenesis protein CcmE|nr:cytochrome c maturation protein CcmE [Rickettsiales bacterium]